jgi:uncharacterized protein YaeQ
MARGATIHRARLELSHVDRGVYADRELTIARHPSETLERMVMRLLAFGLRCDEDLEFGRGVSATDEPDLWRRSGDGRVLEWIEVGQPDAKRLVKAARRSGDCRVFVFGDGADRWRKAQLEGAKLPDNVGVARIDDAFVAALVREVDRQIRWAMTVAEGTIFLDAGTSNHESTPEVWLGDPLG